MLVNHPTKQCITMIGFLECSNGHTWDQHLIAYGNVVVLESEDCAVEMLLRLRSNQPRWLRWLSYWLCFWGIMATENERKFDDVTVPLVPVFSADDENRTAEHFHSKNRGYTIGQVVEFASKHDNLWLY